MKKRDIALFLMLIFFIASCGPSRRGLFGEKKSAHEKYGDRIKDAGLDKTQLGSLWFAAAGNSLSNPLSVNLPHKETGYFSAEEPRAAGYIFDAKRGSQLNISVSVVPSDSLTLFTELWQPGEQGKIKLLAAADSTLKLKYEIEKDGPYVLRLQPQLLEALEYTLTVTTSPSLAFPVSETGNPKLISFWSDPRDMGARSHEGVDISAKFRTPAIAAADGHVQRVTNNRLGGKVVFMRPQGKDYALYYAHLDTQTVSTGQTVKAGQTLGLVGNTGNAKGTVPHLHFGIYALGGAVDPLPYINPKVSEPSEIKAPTENLNKWIRTTTSAELYKGPFAKANTIREIGSGTVLKVLSATGDFYKVFLPDGAEGFVRSKSTSAKLLRTQTADSTIRLLDRPLLTAASRRTIDAKTTFNILGSYGNFYLAEHNASTGWIPK